jgi:hypothetical protein
LKRNPGTVTDTSLKIALTWALMALATVVMAGCQIGPFDFGGSPAPTGVAGSTPQASSPSEAATPQPPGGRQPAQPTATAAQRSLTGRVEDAYTGQPVASAEITAGGILTQTNSDGTFAFDALPLEVTVSARAEGYAPADVEPTTSGNISIKLRPSTLSGRVTDATNGQALAGVLVKLALPHEPVAPSATVTAQVPVTATVVATATAPTTGTLLFGKPMAAPVSLATPVTTTTSSPKGVSTEGVSTATPTEVLPTNTPLPPTATPTPKPIPPTGEGFVAVYTDDNGSYFFRDVPQNASLTFKMPGYKLTRMPVGDTAKKDVALDVFKAEAIYITAPVAATKNMMDELIQFVDTSRINAVVINVQNDNSEWVFDTKNPDVLAAGDVDLMLPQMPEMVKALKDKGIYTIARVVTFQQPTFAKARPELAVKSSASGKVWIGGELSQQAWLDASVPAAQDYVVEMTKEVLALGFDEIQYDYVRFPSDPAPGERGKPVFSQPLTDTQKAEFIQQFLKKAHAVIEPTDAFMSIDIFGYTLWPDQQGKPLNGVIGQVFEYLADHSDYICPMIYPSHFSRGEQGCPKPENCAYQMVKKSGEFAMKRFEGKKAKYRPWLQDFDWFSSDYTSPGTTKVAEQIRAAAETNAWGWQMWDPWNAYEPRAAFKE